MSDIDKEIKKLEATSFYPKWVRKDKVAKIKDLDIFPQVHDWILNCLPDAEIGRRIQEHGFMVDEALSTIIGYISHYKATVPPGQILVRQRPADIARSYKKLTPMKHYIEYLDEMMMGQLEEVQKARQMAQTADVPIGVYGDEIERYIKILQNVMRLRKDAGLSDRDIDTAISQDPSSFDLDKIYGRQGITERLKDPKSRVKILGTVERLLEMVQAKQSKGEEFSFEQIIDTKNEMSEQTEQAIASVDNGPVVSNPVQPISEESVEIIEQIDLSTLMASDFISED